MFYLQQPYSKTSQSHQVNSYILQGKFHPKHNGLLDGMRWNPKTSHGQNGKQLININQFNICTCICMLQYLWICSNHLCMVIMSGSKLYYKIKIWILKVWSTIMFSSLNPQFSIFDGFVDWGLSFDLTPSTYLWAVLCTSFFWEKISLIIVVVVKFN